MSRSTIPSKRPAEAQEAAWIADEDRFVLQQAKKKAALRLKGGRSQPIDTLAVALVVMEPDRHAGLEEEAEELQSLPLDPESVFDGLGEEALRELEKGIGGYEALETSRGNLEYWGVMKAIAQDRIKQQSQESRHNARGMGSVSVDLEKLLGPKNLEQLEKLEKQIKTKLSSDQEIDTDYWENLLQSLLTYKARAKLRQVSKAIVESRMGSVREQQVAEASAWKDRLEARFVGNEASDDSTRPSSELHSNERHPLDPEAVLRLQKDDKMLQSISGTDFAETIANDRKRVLKQGYIATQKRKGDGDGYEISTKRHRSNGNENAASTSGGATVFDREVARGLGENEEIFTAEEPVTTKNLANWSSTHRARKPQYFNRCLLGYEWNKYNQTHYDADNPPPRVVQGYKFNVFYPDLVDKTKAPTYRIEREGGRRKGETWAAAGEQDTCVIRFTAGPPYEDVAFRIVDREWDYSAKRERGFKSSFDKGILQLHFQFKKIYYRK